MKSRGKKVKYSHPRLPKVWVLFAPLFVADGGPADRLPRSFYFLQVSGRADQRRQPPEFEKHWRSVVKTIDCQSPRSTSPRKRTSAFVNTLETPAAAVASASTERRLSLTPTSPARVPAENPMLFKASFSIPADESAQRNNKQEEIFASSAPGAQLEASRLEGMKQLAS